MVSMVPMKKDYRKVRTLLNFKRSNHGCSSKIDVRKYAELDNVCYDCFQRYRAELLDDCRDDCYDNPIFWMCVDAMSLSNKRQYFKELIQQLTAKH